MVENVERLCTVLREASEMIVVSGMESSEMALDATDAAGLRAASSPRRPLVGDGVLGIIMLAFIWLASYCIPSTERKCSWQSSGRKCRMTFLLILFGRLVSFVRDF